LQAFLKDIKLEAMPLLGDLCLLFALALAGYCFVVGIVAAVRKDALGYRLAETGRRAGMASFVAVTGAALALVWVALNNDFSVAYILHHSNRALPTPYKLAALWSGQEVRCFSGRGCWPRMASYFVCGIKSTAGWWPILP